MRITALMVTLALAAAALAADSPELRRTRIDMSPISIAIEAYFTDHGEYPAAKTLEELREKITPVYVTHMAMNDAWGTPFAYRYVNGKDAHFRLSSAGPDRKFDPSSLDLTKKPAKSDDIVYDDGALIRR